MTTPASLSEKEVRARLARCSDPSIVDEIYTFGQILENSAIDQIKILESKAVSFAAYGAAIVTILVSSSAAWSHSGNDLTIWAAVCAGFCGFVCTWYSVRAITLKQFENISQDEWLNIECLSDLQQLKRYRILTLWGSIDSHDKVQKGKAKKMKRAQVWLAGAVIFLVYLLFQVAFLRGLIAFRQSAIQGHFWVSGWQGLFKTSSGLGSLGFFLILGFTLAFVIWQSRRI